MEFPDLVIFDPTAPPIDQTALIYGNGAMDTLEAIVYPEGTDNPWIFDPDPDNGDIMPDSQRIIETHFYIEDVHRFLGCVSLPDGSVRTFPQPRPFEGPEGIPTGWQFYGANSQGAGIYQKRSRILAQDAFGRPLFLPGGYVQCHNLLQRLDCYMDDMTYQLGGDEATGFLIPTADGDYVPCTSIFNAVAQSAYTISQIAYGVNQIKIQCRQILSIAADTLRGLGIPLHKKKIVVRSNKESGETWVPALNHQSPTVSSQLGIILANLSMVVAQGLKVTKIDEH